MVIYVMNMNETVAVIVLLTHCWH